VKIEKKRSAANGFEDIYLTLTDLAASGNPIFLLVFCN
jgi:hypothetical protein